MTYFADVKFIDRGNPDLVQLNAREFQRMTDLLDSARPTLRRAKDNTVWEGAGRDKYDARLADAGHLLDDLAAAFTIAHDALAGYAPELEKAKNLVREGRVTEGKLADLINSVADAWTSEAKAAEPMRKWEDIRSTTGFFDWVAELGVDVESIRADAERYYDETNTKFSTAKQVEETARARCLADLGRAYEALPDFRADSTEAAAIIAGIPDIAEEATQAASNPNVQLAGTGAKTDYGPSGVAQGAVSPALAAIKAAAAELPGGNVGIPWYQLWERDDSYREEWIRDNQAVIRAAAGKYGLPPDLVAGIAWQEVGGEAYWTDREVFGVRNSEEVDNPKLDPNDDQRSNATSMGPIAVQVRRAAETLGYDPATMTQAQRMEVVEALNDPKQNIFIAASHLADLKQETDFASDATLTQDQYRELAARYNGGPYWESKAAQGYGNGFMTNLPKAQLALGR
ncbi:hypothetical protein [Goodfellowiella coeruleoviolacea]|uniref:Uncharacterized protein n=1 Tax=Goodfellowiella coeruleoviolacea TaxID=334858 RepID=A0AAE3G7Q9_9PSEU|nr:hypothetical protein [Goodfellowiella coeruleoviolacea]MCP2163187.1 hypothetical protein [Goodfellowiella coeruleoviolacea]